MSPYYPNTYDNNLICDWLIVVGEDETILFEFLDLETEEHYDIIQVGKHNVSLGRILFKLNVVNDAYSCRFSMETMIALRFSAGSAEVWIRKLPTCNNHLLTLP